MLLDLNVQTTSRLGLEPIKGADGKYLYAGGIVPARIIDISLDYMEHKKGEFKDMKVPVLAVEFENFKLSPSDPDRHYTHTFRPVGTKALAPNTDDQYTDRPAIDIDADTQDLWKAIKHFLENLTGSPNYRNIANVPKSDITTYFDLPGIGAAKDRLDKYEKFFNYIVAFVKGDGKDIKSQLLDAEGKALPIWVKMLPNYDKDYKRNAKYYVIPRFINQGVFEPMKVDKGLPAGTPKIIRIKPAEKIELSSVSSAPAANAPGAPGGVIPGNVDPSVANLLRG